MPIKFRNVVVCCFIVIFFLSCKKKEYTVYLDSPTIDWNHTRNFYINSLEKSMAGLDSLANETNRENAKLIFAQVRADFKKAEAYAAYLNPEIGHRANGPALPVFKEDSERVMPPLGLQKIEETIYEAELDKNLLQEIEITKGLFQNLLDYLNKKELNAQRFFMCTHEQLLRIISFSISGFDTPISQLGLEEAIVSLSSLETVYERSIQSLILEKQPFLNETFKNNITSAINFIEANKDFESFDRYTFIRDYMNPVTREWVAIRKASDLWDAVDYKVFNYDAPTFFETNSFNPDFFMPITSRNATEAQLKLGERLFFEPKLSEAGNMACATCHIPSKAYADGIVANLDNKGKDLKRNTPTLINSIYQRALFWDGRSATLNDQISSVFTNEDEFNTNVHQFSEDILQDSSYFNLFRKAYGRVPKKNREVVNAIAFYISKLNGMNSKFDKNIRAEENSFTKQEQLGMNLFMGKALCATCHFMPLTNGSVPPFYTETEKEVIGVPETSKNLVLDDDDGFFWRWKQPIHKGMFKTPTIRNIELTAPYMHNGVYNTLEEVMDFYNQGGGAGLGFDLEHQTLPFDNLNLTKEEIDAIISFMKTLSDNYVAKEPVY